MINIFSCEMTNNFSSRKFVCVFLLLFFQSAAMFVDYSEGFYFHSQNNFSTVFPLIIIMIFFCSSSNSFSVSFTTDNINNIRVPYEELIKFPPNITLIFWYILFVLCMICEREWKFEGGRNTTRLNNNNSDDDEVESKVHTRKNYSGLANNRNINE